MVWKTTNILSTGVIMIFKKQFKINLITILYSRYYQNEKSEIIDPIYWLKKTNYKIYNGEQLINKGKFKNASALIASEKYIPYSKTNISQVEMEFINKFCPEAKKEIENIQRSAPDSDFDIAFRIFIETHPLNDKWGIYLTEHLRDDVIKWCIKNRIKYTIDKKVL